MLDQLDSEFAFNREALDVRAYRQELLSSNIANADTPGYKARDVDFASSLAGALKKAGAAGDSAMMAGNSSAAPLAMTQPAGVTMGMSMATTEPGHMTGAARLIPVAPPETYGNLQYRIPAQPSLDGNTVDFDTERVQFADNSLHYETGVTMVSGQVKGLLAAITT
jgi:flagellar basal-body rod protein FlgB